MVFITSSCKCRCIMNLTTSIKIMQTGVHLCTYMYKDRGMYAYIYIYMCVHTRKYIHIYHICTCTYI